MLTFVITAQPVGIRKTLDELLNGNRFVLVSVHSSQQAVNLERCVMNTFNLSPASGLAPGKPVVACIQRGRGNRSWSGRPWSRLAASEIQDNCSCWGTPSCSLCWRHSPQTPLGSQTCGKWNSRAVEKRFQPNLGEPKTHRGKDHKGAEVTATQYYVPGSKSPVQDCRSRERFWFKKPTLQKTWTSRWATPRIRIQLPIRCVVQLSWQRKITFDIVPASPEARAELEAFVRNWYSMYLQTEYSVCSGDIEMKKYTLA